jgi:hypothetical protein
MDTPILKTVGPIRGLVKISIFIDELTVSVVYWSKFLTTDPEVPGSMSGATRLFEK